ncbi:MAG: HAMP domain-containing histidine kinase [Sedimenticola sp.]|nr:HAMP domain-containing histidine kinase [Sedimenticola sp.]MCW8919967.1 HAMP domain-containing histidine kinase [Sedimenticola sp.]MCW8946824.1 HAMP domain-containing histidine kinase [Sedimenticola sp.]MCW8949019.1 HAMP domain-containing histidine kinase [Sedimenticola sp.]MCW8974126.1 HAMP domain-containing histidine kinase [Sedimenticola sp.]
MKFYDVLASLIHDMKNSLSMVVHTLEQLTEDPSFRYDKPERVTALQNEAKRLNNNLIELLTLYNIENERISATIDDVDVTNFLEEVVAENHASAEANHIRLEYECDPDLYGYFDEGLVRGVLNNLVGNGLRYTRDQLLLSARQEDNYLVFRVEDNGPGYPKQMLAAQSSEDLHRDIAEGRTQLGLYFATLIAEMHKNKGQAGFIRLENGYTLSGGCFSVWLP